MRHTGIIMNSKYAAKFIWSIVLSNPFFAKWIYRAQSVPVFASIKTPFILSTNAKLFKSTSTFENFSKKIRMATYDIIVSRCRWVNLHPFYIASQSRFTGRYVCPSYGFGIAIPKTGIAGRSRKQNVKYITPPYKTSNNI
jgi:hypothetical protein